jgi:hypothetical protein
VGWEGPVASVFGRARAVDGDAEYERAREVGRLIASAGWAVMTGGYSGVMEAASRGAVDVDGHAIGVTVSSWDTSPNDWLTEERRAADLFDRLRTLVSADALIAVGGGIGTLTEVALSWNLRQKGHGTSPLILVGGQWRRVVAALSRELVLDAEDGSHLVIVDHPDAISEHLRR